MRCVSVRSAACVDAACRRGGRPVLRYHVPHDVPCRGPVEGEPALCLIRLKGSGELETAGGVCHPSVDGNLPEATVSGACAQNPGVRMEGEVADVAVGQAVGEVGPVRPGVEGLVNAAIHSDPGAGCVAGVDLNGDDGERGQSRGAIGPTGPLRFGAVDLTTGGGSVDCPDALWLARIASHRRMTPKLSMSAACPGRRTERVLVPICPIRRLDFGAGARTDSSEGWHRRFPAD
jgi:hypothetical protein